MPDPTTLLGDVSRALSVVAHSDSDDVSEGTLADLAQRLDLLRRSQQMIKELIEMVEAVMIDAMDEDQIATGPYVVIREPTTRSEWRDGGAERMREDMRRAVVERFCLDPETGEVNTGRRNLLVEAINELYDGIPSFSSIKQGAAKRWHLHISDYRAFSNGHSIKIIPAVP